jgi:hypothetical protein
MMMSVTMMFDADVKRIPTSRIPLPIETDSAIIDAP